MFFAAVLADAERAVDAVVLGLDPDTMTASSAMDLVGRLDRLERKLAGAKMVLAGRVADSQAWKHRGDRSAAHWLAGQARRPSVADAVNVLETAERLKELPATAAAVPRRPPCPRLRPTRWPTPPRPPPKPRRI